MAVAVLGDSDSHGYRDTVSFTPGGPLRGGEYRRDTLQWTEVLHDLRGDTIYQGDFGVWGGRAAVVGLLERLGMERRAPRKQDHQFNLAFSGAQCADLLTGVRRQVPRLLRLMDCEPERWRGGVVIVRIGIVDLGGTAQLDAMAQDPNAPEVAAQIDRCVAQIGAAVAAIRARHDQTRCVVVGIFDNTNVPALQDRWRSAVQLDNIRAALDRFDGGLRALAQQSEQIVFFDDRAWFAARWGGRDAVGRPDYRSLEIAGLRVEHGCGDAPTYTALADGHAGLVVNTLWAQSLTQLLHAELGLPIEPLQTAEVEAWLRTRYRAR